MTVCDGYCGTVMNEIFTVVENKVIDQMVRSSQRDHARLKRYRKMKYYRLMVSL